MTTSKPIPDRTSERIPDRTENSRWRSLRHRWPSALGLAAAGGQLATGGDRDSVAVVVCVAALCYLGAAALRRRWIAWAGVAGGSLVVAATELAGLPWWAGIGGTALALVAAGLLGGASRPVLTVQTAALLGYGGLAVATLRLAPRLGLVLAGVVLASHAGWDLVHYRRDRVVPRSLAEFCMLLDAPLGAGVIILAIAG